MATIPHASTTPDPIHAAIERHRAAYDAFQTAPQGAPSFVASDEYAAATDALVSTACATRFGALALVSHLVWWLGEEAEFKAAYQPAYDLAQARVSDLTLFLGSPLAPAVRSSADVLAGFLPLATPAGRLGHALPACDLYRHDAPSVLPNEAMPGKWGDAALIVASRPDTAHARASRLLTLSGEVLTGFLIIGGGTVLTGLASLL